MAKRATVTRKAGGAKAAAARKAVKAKQARTRKTRATAKAAAARLAGAAKRTVPVQPAATVQVPKPTGMPPRARAWLLVKAKDPASAQAEIGKLMPRGNGQIPVEDVVVRADTVEGEFDLVVPVDASGVPGLKAIVGLVSKMSSVRRVTVLQVRGYLPEQVVEAHCFIHPSERRFPFLRTGRYGKSPGWNPWG